MAQDDPLAALKAKYKIGLPSGETPDTSDPLAELKAKYNKPNAPVSAAYSDAGASQPNFVQPMGPSKDVGAPTPYVGGHDAGIPNEDEVIRGAGQDPNLVKRSPHYRPGSLAALATDKTGFSGSKTDRFAYGAAQAPINLADLAGHLVSSPESNALFKTVLKIQQDKYNAAKPEGKDIAGGLGEMAGTAALLPNPESMAGAVGTGIAAGAMQGVDPSDPNYAQTKAIQMGAGGLAGGLTHGVLHSGGGLAQEGLGAAAKGVEGHNPQTFDAELAERASKIPYEDLDQIKKVAAIPGHPRQKEAKAVLDAVDEAGKDMPRVMQTSLGLQAVKAKLASDAAFAQRNALAEGVSVDVSHPLKVLDDILAELEDPKLASKWPDADKQNMVPELKKLRDSLAGNAPAKDVQVPIPGVIGADGKPLTQTQAVAGEATPNTFRNISSTRSSLGDVIGNYYKANNAVIGEHGASSLQRVKNALEESLHETAQKSGNAALADADTAARKTYAQTSKTFRDRQIVAAMTDTNPDTVLPRFEKGSQDRAQKLYNALDPKGRAAAMSGIADAGAKAMADADGDLNAFRKAMMDRQKSIGVFFQGDDAKRMQGIMNLAKTTNLISKGTFPVVGAVLGAAGGAHSFGGGLLPALTGLGGFGAGATIGHFGAEKLDRNIVNWMLTSPTSANFLKNLGGLTPGSSTFYRFVGTQLPKQVAAYKASQAGMERFNQTINTQPKSPMELPSPGKMKAPK
jgi:hypothetical protein